MNEVRNSLLAWAQCLAERNGAKLEYEKADDGGLVVNGVEFNSAEMQAAGEAKVSWEVLAQRMTKAVMKV